MRILYERFTTKIKFSYVAMNSIQFENRPQRFHKLKIQMYSVSIFWGHCIASSIMIFRTESRVWKWLLYWLCRHRIQCSLLSRIARVAHAVAQTNIQNSIQWCCGNALANIFELTNCHRTWFCVSAIRAEHFTLSIGWTIHRIGWQSPLSLRYSDSKHVLQSTRHFVVK